MGFIVSKVLLSLLLPPASLLLLMLAGVILLRWHRNAGRALVAAAMVLLYGLSLHPVADRLIRPLEASYRPLSDGPVKADAIVVLGGGSRDLSWVPKEPELSGGSLERLAGAVQLAKKHHLPLVVSGGSGEPRPGAIREADVMADVAMRLGFPAKDIVIENRSRNTWENAEAVQKLLPGKTVVLVTSAFHMRRSARMFKKQGFTVLPAPAGYSSQSRHGSFTDYLPHAAALAQSSTAISEYISLSWYWMTGKI
ncbi:MAG: YdcF family protein [Nitrospirota bacterium]